MHKVYIQLRITYIEMYIQRVTPSVFLCARAFAIHRRVAILYRQSNKLLLPSSYSWFSNYEAHKYGRTLRGICWREYRLVGEEAGRRGGWHRGAEYHTPIIYQDITLTEFNRREIKRHTRERERRAVDTLLGFARRHIHPSQK